MTLVDSTTNGQDTEALLKAIASERRIQILEWLKDPVAHFPEQVHGDPLVDGACNQFIADKLGVSQPAASRHLKVLTDAGMIVPTARKGWTYYRRDEAAIDAVKQLIQEL